MNFFTMHPFIRRVITLLLLIGGAALMALALLSCGGLIGPREVERDAELRAWLAWRRSSISHLPSAIRHAP